MGKPVIAVTLNIQNEAAYAFPGYLRVALNEDYSRSIAAAGGVAVMLAPGEDVSVVADQLERVDGVILSGGSDVAPLRYGQQPRRVCQPPTPIRDAYEFEVLRVAEERGLPTFGICRGQQIMNVFYGGTLHQDLSEAGTTLAHDQLGNPATSVHDVELTGFAAAALGTTHTVVNSFHHQAVNALAEGFQVAATAPDGIIEAIERPGDRLLAAVQWHPEMASRENLEAQALFRWLVERIADTRAAGR